MGWTQFHSWAGKRKLYEPTEQRTLLMTPPVTIVPVVGPTLMPTGTIPGRDAYVVLYDVLASLKMRSAAAKPAWFEGECGNPHTIPPRVPLTHHFPFSQSAHAIKCSICSYLCTALRRDIHHVYLRGSRSLAKQRVRTKPTVISFQFFLRRQPQKNGGKVKMKRNPRERHSVTGDTENKFERFRGFWN